MTERKSDLQSVSRQDGERGVALIIALLAMTVLTALGFALMVSSSTESLINSSFRRAGVAIYAARGGLEEARGRMGPGAGAATSGTTSIRIPCTGCGALTPTHSYYIRLAATVDPTNSGCTFQGASCAEATYFPSMPAATTTNFFLSTQPTPAGGTQIQYAWVRINQATQRKLLRDFTTPCQTTNASGANYCAPSSLNDTTYVCWNGSSVQLATVANPTCAAPLSPVLVFTSLAVQPGGNASGTPRGMRQIATYGQIPPLPAALTLDGPDPTCNFPSSNNFFIDGTDAATPPTPVPAVGVIDDSDIAPCIAGIPKNRLSHYPGVNPSPDIENIAPAMNSLYQSCDGLASLMATLQSSADYYYSGNQTSLTNPGTLASPVINFVNGNLDIAGSWTGAGILVVTGNLTFSGNSAYDGVIYVVGTGSYLQNGGGNGQYNGGIFVANTTTCAGTGNLGSPSYQVNGGGNNGVQYDSSLVSPPGGYLPLRMLSLNY